MLNPSEAGPSVSRGLLFFTVYNLGLNFTSDVNLVPLSDGTPLGLAVIDVGNGKVHVFLGLSSLLYDYSSNSCCPFPIEQREIPEGHAQSTSCSSFARAFISPASCSPAARRAPVVDMQDFFYFYFLDKLKLNVAHE